MTAFARRTRPVRIPCLGRPPSGRKAWLEEGRIEFRGERSTSIELHEHVAVSPPRWYRGRVELCAIDDRAQSVLLSVSADRAPRRLYMPRATIDAVRVLRGWCIARADCHSGQVIELGLVNLDGCPRRLFPVSHAWKLHGSRKGDGVHWAMSRNGIRTDYVVTDSGVQCASRYSPTPAWERWVIRLTGLPAVPAWVKPSESPERVWIVLHGGPGLAWDIGPPRWLALAAAPSDAIVLLESPGSAGYSASLLRWGYETQPEKAFTRIIQQACARIRRRWHTSRLVLAGESAGACIVFEFLAHARTHLDAAVLINGEYRSPSSACVPPTLFVVSTEDDVVEINSAVAAFDALRAGGAPVERCYVSDGHRWRHACSARKVAGAIRKMLRAAFVVV